MIDAKRFYAVFSDNCMMIYNLEMEAEDPNF